MLQNKGEPYKVIDKKLLKSIIEVISVVSYQNGRSHENIVKTDNFQYLMILEKVIIQWIRCRVFQSYGVARCYNCNLGM